MLPQKENEMRIAMLLGCIAFTYFAYDNPNDGAWLGNGLIAVCCGAGFVLSFFVKEDQSWPSK